MFLIGLTGGIGSGKSTVTEMLRMLSVEVLDADQFARSVVQPGKKGWQNIKNAFGDSVIDAGGRIDRARLAQIIFEDPDKRELLNKCTHGEIAKEIGFEIILLFLKGRQFVVIDAPLLFETDTWLKYVHKSILVYVEEKTQITRVMRRDQLTRTDARQRIFAQMPLEEKCALADIIIDNNGSPDDTFTQVQIIYAKLRQSRMHWKIRFLIASIFCPAFAAFCFGISYFFF